MHPPLHACASRRGFAIVTATLVLVALMALAVALSDTTVGSLRMSQLRTSDTSLTVSTESVANIAFNHVQNLPDLETELIRAKSRAASSDEAILTDEVLAAATIGGSVRLNGVEPRVTWKWLGTVTVPIMGSKEQQDLYQITATAAVAGPVRLYNSDGTRNPIEDVNRYRRRRVEVLFTKFPQTSYRQAMFARRGYDFMGSATTDSWNSKGDGSTPYASAAKGAEGDLSSEGTIVVQKPTNVKGDVNSNVKMPVPPLTYRPPSDRVILPAGPEPGGTLAKTSGIGLADNMLGGTDPSRTYSYECAKIAPSGNNTIVIRPGAKVDIYVKGPILIKNDWVIPPSSTVRIFQDDYDATAYEQTTLNGNITVGCLSNPRAFQIYSLYDGRNADGEDPIPWDVKMNGTAALGGVVFCPFTSFKLNGTFDYFGSLIAESFRETDTDSNGKVNGAFSFHYDESLNNMPLPFPPSLVVIGWRSYDLGLAEYVNPHETDPAKKRRYDDP